MRPLLVAAALLLAGCAGTPASPAAPDEPTPAGELTVEVDPGDGAPAERWTLACDPVQGDHPDAAAACAALAGDDDPFAPLPDDVVCTEQYGGPQTARVTGRWAGEDVDLELSRINGCTIDQWNRLTPLLPVDLG